jgi:hypothetical protein
MMSYELTAENNSEIIRVRNYSISLSEVGSTVVCHPATASKGHYQSSRISGLCVLVASVSISYSYYYLF